MEDFIKSFGKRVKELRKMCGFSQEKFAEKLELSPTTVMAIETGKNFVTYKTLKNICTVLNVAPRDLFDFDVPAGNKKDKKLKQITAHIKSLSDEQQQQVLDILKTFK